MSFSAYPIYKNSGDEWLSEVPQHWDVLPLKRFAEVDNSGCYGVEPADGDHIRPVATTAQIDSEGRFDVGRMSDRGFSAQELARYECSPGDVLVVKSSGSAENIISGKAGLVREDTPAFVFSNFLMRLRYRKDVCLPSFLYSLLISHLTRERIKQMCSTTTYPNLQVGLYTSAKLPCPPLSEQTQIARFLDHETARIDALIEEQQRLIELLKEKRQAVISRAVTKGLDPTAPMKDSGVEWLGEVPAHWQVKRLKHLVPSITVGIVVEPSKYYVDDGVPALRSLNVKPGAVVAENLVYLSEESNELHAKSKIFEGDIVAVRSGQPGTAAIVPLEFNGANCIDLIVIRKPLQGCSTFIFWYLNSDAALKQFSEGSSGAIQQHFNIAAASEMLFAWPPASEQLEINSHLDRACHQLDRLISVAGESKSLLLDRRSALISAAVTGKIDVRAWQPPASTQAPEPAVAEAN